MFVRIDANLEVNVNSLPSNRLEFDQVYRGKVKDLDESWNIAKDYINLEAKAEEIEEVKEPKKAKVEEVEEVEEVDEKPKKSSFMDLLNGKD